MATFMVQVYFKLVVNNLRTIEEVPERHREAVQKLLDELTALGLDGNGNLIE